MRSADFCPVGFLHKLVPVIRPPSRKFQPLVIDFGNFLLPLFHLNIRQPSPVADIEDKRENQQRKEEEETCYRKNHLFQFNTATPALRYAANVHHMMLA